MTEDTGHVVRGEETRVRIRTRVVGRADVPAAANLPGRRALTEAERRFLALQSSRSRGETSQILTDYLQLTQDLAVIDMHLEETSGRRDIPFVTDRRIHLLRDYCRWLVRRVSTEFLLVLQVQLEQELRQVIGPEAYQLLLRFEEMKDAVRDIEMLTDDDLMARLRSGTLFRDVLQHARLGDRGEWTPPWHPPAARSGD